jgi:hypothetical protein
MDYDNSESDKPDAQRDGIGLRTLTPPAFAALGNGQVAYVKAVEVDGESGWAVHGADGSALAVVADRDVAFALIRQNDLEPVSVH